MRVPPIQAGLCKQTLQIFGISVFTYHLTTRKDSRGLRDACVWTITILSDYVIMEYNTIPDDNEVKIFDRRSMKVDIYTCLQLTTSIEII